MAWKKTKDGTQYLEKKNKKGIPYGAYWISSGKRNNTLVGAKGPYVVERGGWDTNVGRRRIYARKSFKTRQEMNDFIIQWKKSRK